MCNVWSMEGGAAERAAGDDRWATSRRPSSSCAAVSLQQNSIAQHWARDWRALALTQVHQ